MAEFDEYEYLERQMEENGRDRRPDSRSGRDGREGRDRERGRERDRSDSHGPPRGQREYGAPSRGRERYRGQDFDRRGPPRQRSRSPRGPRRGGAVGGGGPPGGGGRPSTPPEVREAREREKELVNMERDTRTVFAYNLNLKADERDIFEFFSRAGKVMDVKIITDRHTRKSKGFAYIELGGQEDVLNALALTGQVLMGQAVMVKASEAEKNLAWEAQQQMNQNQQAAAALLGDALGSGPCKLQVTNIHPNITESDLQTLFSTFGNLESAAIVRDGQGKSQGHGTVTYKSASDAALAVKGLHGREIAGLPLKVTVVTNTVETVYGPGYSELDEDENGGGVKLSSHARVALMNRLAQAAGMEATKVTVAVPDVTAAAGARPAQAFNPLAMEQGVLGPPSPIPTCCLLLKNMFDPQGETEPNWDSELASDVQDECSKHGSVVHVHVDKNSKGFVYIKYTSADSASAAQRELNGRWFGGRQLLTEFQFLQPYNSYFKL